MMLQIKNVPKDLSSTQSGYEEFYSHFKRYYLCITFKVELNYNTFNSVIFHLIMCPLCIYRFIIFIYVFIYKII